MQNNQDSKVVEHLLNIGNCKYSNEYESDSSIEDKHSINKDELANNKDELANNKNELVNNKNELANDKNELFYKIFTLWSKKNYETFVASDLHSIATNVFSSHYNRKLKFGQVNHNLRGFYYYISKLDSNKYPKIKIIKDSFPYANSMKNITPNRKPKLIVPKAPKREIIPYNESSYSSDDEDEINKPPIIKRMKFEDKSSDIINQIKKLPFNVFIMLNELNAINLKGEFIKKVKLDILKIKEIGNINTIMQLVELNIIEDTLYGSF
jgi:hypothetical protein